MKRKNLTGFNSFPLTSNDTLREVYLVVDIPRGEKMDYMYRKDGDVIKLCPPTPIPENYGFVPQTLTKNNETLDAVLFSEETPTQGMAVESRVVGGIEFNYDNLTHLKLLTVARQSADLENIRSYRELPDSRLNRVTEFFQSKVRNKNLNWLDQYEAFEITLESISRFHQSNPGPGA